MPDQKVEMGTAMEGTNIKAIQIVFSHNAKIKELGDTLKNARRNQEWVTAGDACRDICSEIDQAIAELKRLPDNLSSTILARIATTALAMVINTVTNMLTDGDPYVDMIVNQRIVNPLMANNSAVDRFFRLPENKVSAATLASADIMVRYGANFAAIDYLEDHPIPTDGSAKATVPQAMAAPFRNIPGDGQFNRFPDGTKNPAYRTHGQVKADLNNGLLGFAGLLNIASDVKSTLAKNGRGPTNISNITVESAVEMLPEKSRNAIVNAAISDLTRVKLVYAKLAEMFDAEGEAVMDEMDDAIESFADAYAETFDSVAAMEGATLDAMDSLRAGLKRVRPLRKQMRALKKKGNNEGAAKCASEIAKIAQMMVKEVDMIPESVMIPQLTDFAIMILGSFITSKIMDKTVLKFFHKRAESKVNKINAKVEAGKMTAEKANAKIAKTASGGTAGQYMTMTAVNMILGNPLGAVVAKINKAASGDKEEWNENDRNLIINAIRLQMKHLVKKYTKLANDLRAGKAQMDKDPDAAQENFTLFGMTVPAASAMEEEADEFDDFFVTEIDDFTEEEEEECLEAYSDYFDAMVDDLESSLDSEVTIYTPDIGFAAALEKHFAVGKVDKKDEKDARKIFNEFRSNIKKARSQMKRAARKKQWNEAADWADKAAEYSKGMLNEINQIPSTVTGVVLGWIATAVMSVVVSAAVAALAGEINAIMKETPKKIDEAYRRTVADEAKHQGREGLKKAIVGVGAKISKKDPETVRAALHKVNAGRKVVGENAKYAKAVVSPAQTGLEFGKDKLKAKANAAINEKLVQPNLGKIGDAVSKASKGKVSKEMTERVARSAGSNLLQGAKELKDTESFRKGKATAAGVMTGLRTIGTLKKVSKIAGYLSKKNAMTKEGTIEGSKLAASDFNPLVVNMKADMQNAISRYQGYAKLYREKARMEGMLDKPKKEAAEESWLETSTSAGTQSWLL